MLTLRDDQCEALWRSHLEDWLIDHVRLCFAEKCAALGTERVRETVRDGVRRAAAYGLVEGSHAARFVDWVFVLGPDFDSDPKLAWSRAILTHPALDAETRVLTMHDAVTRYLCWSEAQGDRG